MKLMLGFGSPRAAVWWRRLVVMTRKELLQLLRDIPIVLLLVYSFTAGVYLTGNGIRSQLQNARLLVLDGDHSFSSRELLHKFQAPFFSLQGEIADPREGLRALDHGEAMAVLEIPPRFHEQLAAGEPTAVQLLVDTTSAPQGLSAASYARHRRTVRGRARSAARRHGAIFTEFARRRERSSRLVQPGAE
jgi:ABC-2 type transport system permease protein